MQCCLEPLRQRYIGFLPVQCYPKSIKTTSHSIFSYAKLSGASRVTQHRVFSSAMLSQRYYDNVGPWSYNTKVSISLVL